MNVHIIAVRSETYKEGRGRTRCWNVYKEGSDGIEECIADLIKACTREDKGWFHPPDEVWVLESDNHCLLWEGSTQIDIEGWRKGIRVWPNPSPYAKHLYPSAEAASHRVISK